MAKRGGLGDSPKESMMDRAAAEEPKRGGSGDYATKPAGGGKLSVTKGSDIGSGIHKALHGDPMDRNPLKGGKELGGAMKELKSQHPYAHDDHGPHHGKSHHDRHMPLHGLHPKGSHGR